MTKEFKINGKNYQAKKITFAIMQWASDYYDRYKSFADERLANEKKEFYKSTFENKEIFQLANKIKNIKELIKQITDKVDDDTLISFLLLQEKTNEVNKQFLCNSDNLKDLFENYLIDCKINFDEVDNAIALIDEGLEVLNDFLSIFGKLKIQ